MIMSDIMAKLHCSFKSSIVTNITLKFQVYMGASLK